MVTASHLNPPTLHSSVQQQESPQVYSSGYTLTIAEHLVVGLLASLGVKNTHLEVDSAFLLLQCNQLLKKKDRGGRRRDGREGWKRNKLGRCTLTQNVKNVFINTSLPQWPHHNLTVLLYLYMCACRCQSFTEEGSHKLPKGLNYCSVFRLVQPINTSSFMQAHVSRYGLSSTTHAHNYLLLQHRACYNSTHNGIQMTQATGLQNRGCFTHTKNRLSAKPWAEQWRIRRLTLKSRRGAVLPTCCTAGSVSSLKVVPVLAKPNFL